MYEPIQGLDDRQLLGKVIKEFEDAKHHHDYFVRLYEKREKAYRAVKERHVQSRWRHHNKPPYAFNLLETVVASQVEMGLKFEVKPSPHSQYSPPEAQHALMMCDDISDLLRHEHRIDQFDRKQRPLFLCDGIGGFGVGKTYWNYSEGMMREQKAVDVPIHGPNDEIIGTSPTIVEIEKQGVLRDHSTTEVVDPRDFIWHESARSLDPRAPGGMQHVFHRCWYSYQQLQDLKRLGVVTNVDDLQPFSLGEGEYIDRSQELFNIHRQKDLIEILEYWCYEDGEIYTAWIANRTRVVKKVAKSPFWHQGYPFFICSSMPQPFSLNGTSTIELIQDLQEVLHELGNQRLDNVELVNNAITLIRGDVDDPDAWEYYPGARWMVDDPQQVAAFQPPYQVASISIEAENLIKGDLQTVTSAAPFAGGAETGTVDNKTATGASIVMNAAQQQMAMKKYTTQFGLVDEANMRLKNCQQYLDPRFDRLVQILGPDGATMFKSIPPLAIQGEYLAELKAMGESEMRQEKRAEATNFAQLMIGFAPIAAAAQTPLNVQQIIRWFCKQWDIDYPEQFFSEQPGAMGAAGAPGPGGGAPSPDVGAPGGPNLGTTAATAVDASSPSATGGLSMSPQVMLQRAMALQGGPRGGGRQ